MFSLGAETARPTAMWAAHPADKHIINWINAHRARGGLRPLGDGPMRGGVPRFAAPPPQAKRKCVRRPPPSAAEIAAQATKGSYWDASIQGYRNRPTTDTSRPVVMGRYFRVETPEKKG